MNELRIHTAINSRYQVFDASGQLPFSIVFGLCRRSPADDDSRSILLETAGSVLDVPYALAHGLLTIHERNPADATQWIEVDLSRLKNVPTKEGCLLLPSPVNRTEHWKESFTIHLCHIDVKRELALILEPGKKYTIRLASNDLGIKGWAYSDRKQFTNDHEPSSNESPSHDSETAKLVNSKSTASNATFTVVKNLPWPPRIETRMHFYASPSPSASDVTPAIAKPNDGVALDISAVNTGSDSVTVQTRGHQRFLVPWGPFQPESSGYDNGLRIIDARSDRPRTASLQVINSTGEVVERNIHHHSAPLTSPNADQRPKIDDVLILRPGEPVTRKVDIGMLVDPLKDGQYKIRMQPTGCRWWHGEIGETECEDGKIPAHLGEAMIPPLMLESYDEVEFCIRNGKVDQSTRDAASRDPEYET
ncbi:hypothetical protein MMC10_006736 [Thelotrema lepadinum]|nr:hypothetical protein [Thelotrema lepadinum]